MEPPAAHPRFPLVGPAESGRDLAGERALGQGGVTRARLPDGTPVWVAVGYRLSRQVMTHPAFSRRAAAEADAPRSAEGLALPAMLSSLDGTEHARTRRLVMGALPPRRADGMRPWITGVVGELLDAAAALPQPVDLVPALTAPLPARVMCRLFGVPYEDQERFGVWSEMLDSTENPEEVREAFGHFQTYMIELIGHKRARPGPDFTSDLVLLADTSGELDTVEIANNLLMVLGAGIDTTVQQLANSIITLLAERDQYERLCRRPELVDNAVEELLRYLILIPTGTMMRVATRDTELGGWTVRAGEGVVALQHVANRDPDVFPEPGRLDLARPEAVRHLAFGTGRHVCAGAQLARVELRAALGELVRRFPAARLAIPVEELRWRTGSLMRGPVALPVFLH
ncbi:cytochrome P450 [Streptomyces sp. NPDC093252]|uniref:cytochrome P450 n=1 Tax=Streptomyces sp. NPDC093252 TaxID=3154980 RepID=UPI0034298932